MDKWERSHDKRLRQIAKSHLGKPFTLKLKGNSQIKLKPDKGDTRSFK